MTRTLRRMPFSGGQSATGTPVAHVTHTPPRKYELEALLVAVGRHLWVWYRAEARPQYLSDAIDLNAELKREVRA